MRMIVMCENSDVVRSAFESVGFDAWSCDLVPSKNPDNKKHIQDDALNHLRDGWNLMIGHPPCTHLAVSGARWFKDKLYEQPDAIRFFNLLWEAPILRIALENPVSVISSRLQKPTQTIQPYMFGHGEVKRTCLWLKGLPKLVPTSEHSGREARIHKLPPSEDRAEIRSVTFTGVADAMAKQWGLPILAETIDLCLNTQS